MLQELRIKHFAIIDEVDLSFSKGFNVLTGETGAGKSIILNAVHLLLGDRASEDLIRSSEEEASVEAYFELSGSRGAWQKVYEKHSSREEPEEKSLLIRRILSRSGRGKVFLNGSLATLGMLSEVSEELLSICGQHEHQTLQRPDTHIDLLDEFGGLMSLRKEFEEAYEAFSSLQEEIRRVRAEKERRTKERDLMVFQSREIEASGLRPGEEEVLKEERRILLHAEKLMNFSSASEESLYGEEGSALSRVQSILRKGKDIETIDPSLGPLLKNLEAITIQMEEAALGLREYSRKVEINPQRLEEVENRLEEIDRLKRKYGATVEEVLRFKQSLEESLGSFLSDDEKLAHLEGELEPLEKKVDGLAETLSASRKKAAGELKKAIEKELGTLGMKRTAFEVNLEEIPLSAQGRDRVEFFLSPNVGEPAKPLARIASGGELSRIMLAMKRILAKVGGRQVLIFDEVDSGIGGAMAEVVGRKLKELSRQHQVICVTHLPQIASFAETHHSVKKEVKGGRTVTVVDRLEEGDAVEEIARMLGGVKVTEKTRAHAREMMENARRS
jgi:DNA repair protein RecN (Recombination protein N)